jgi:hypothetical protein
VKVALLGIAGLAVFAGSTLAAENLVHDLRLALAADG